ncbi:MAG: IS1634 family transposase [Symploca sp. SIO3E6]|nr:IS1634 family transposase [Caldora sp. SIO3E6]
MNQTAEIDVQDIDHLGIIAGIVDEIGMVEIINDLLGTHPQEQVSAGHVVKALILNCLGFLSAPLYLFHQFFEGKATEHLIGPGVKPEHINDSRIGRVLDKLWCYGLTSVFVTIALAAVKRFGVSSQSVHLDGSSFGVHGKYLDSLQKTPAGESLNTEPSLRQENPGQDNPKSKESSSPVPIEITYGYSRDHRPDLKQYTLTLLTSGDGDVPLSLRVGNGNDSDQAVFTEVIEQFKQQWIAAEPKVFVADAALYSEENLKRLEDTPWISRVPGTITEVQQLMQALPAQMFTPSTCSGYIMYEVCSIYAGMPQRWLVVESQSRQQADLKQLDERVAQQQTKSLKALAQLEAHPFACSADALAAAQGFAKKLKYHLLVDIKTKTKPRYAQRGRPRKGDSPSHYTYHVQGTLVLNEQVLAAHRRQAGRFILATNLLDDQKLSNDAILQEYKNQQSCERGFRFLKDPLFFASRVFVKSPQRVAALAMIMGLCLLVYSLGQRQLRQALADAHATIPNQLGKETAKPTLRWVLQCFQSVHLVWLEGLKWTIKLTDQQRHILRFLGSACEKYYFLC